jgi:hypothetical protein
MPLPTVMLVVVGSYFVCFGNSYVNIHYQYAGGERSILDFIVGTHNECLSK